MSLPETEPELARKQLRKLAAQSTPGPRLRRMRTRYAPGENHGKAASVLMLFGMIGEELSLLFTQRSTDLRHHPGQVAFPGGARDATDPDAIFTALREAEEEIGLLPHEVEVLGTLPPIPVAVSGFLVTPVLAWWKAPRQLLPLDPAETARVFTVMISHMGQEQTRVKTRLEHDGRVFSGPGFDVGHSLVWGFSAFLTEGVLEELGWISQAPQGRARTVNPRDYESEGS